MHTRSADGSNPARALTTRAPETAVPETTPEPTLDNSLTTTLVLTRERSAEPSAEHAADPTPELTEELTPTLTPKPFRWFRAIASAFLLMLAIALLLAAVVVPRLSDATAYTILTGSMQPTLDPGDLAVMQRVDASEVTVGDVITYQLESGEQAVVTHRVVGVAENTLGERTFVTQGDANNVADELAVRPVQIQGKLWYDLPYIGYVNIMFTGAQRGVTTVVVIGFLFLYAIVMFVQSSRERRRRVLTTTAATLIAAALVVVAPWNAPAPAMAAATSAATTAVRSPAATAAATSAVATSAAIHPAATSAAAIHSAATHSAATTATAARSEASAPDPLPLLSLNGESWAPSVESPLSRNGDVLVPGSATSVRIWVQNPTPDAAQLTFDILATAGSPLWQALLVTAEVSGEPATLTAGGSTAEVWLKVPAMRATAKVPVDVTFQLDPAAGNETQNAVVPVAFRVTLTQNLTGDPTPSATDTPTPAANPNPPATNTPATTTTTQTATTTTTATQNVPTSTRPNALGATGDASTLILLKTSGTLVLCGLLLVFFRMARRSKDAAR